MAYSRYSRRETFINDTAGYKQKFFVRPRGVQQIQQYESPVFTFPQADEISAELSLDTATWQVGTRMDKIAGQFYGDSTLWWLIAWFNKKPTEGHWKIGDLIYIPQPLSTALDLFERGQ